ncbi:MAG: DUF1640 domain-containing protein [Rhodocyclaceae bacterium]|nr:DUF1640 domain-containing protein [Rhodocyclaceae bacterium]
MELQIYKALTEAGVSAANAPAVAQSIESELGRRIAEKEIATKRYLIELEYRLSMKLGAMMAASIALVATLVKML